MSSPDITITWADVLVRCPAMSVIVDTTLQNTAIDDAKLRLKNVNWGDRANVAAVYLVAHICAISLRKANEAMGPVSDISVDDVSRSWATPSEIDNYDATNWGSMYKALRNSIFKLNGTLLNLRCTGGW